MVRYTLYVPKQDNEGLAFATISIDEVDASKPVNNYLEGEE